MTEHRLPGLAVAVVRDGRVLLARGYGHADIARRVPVTPRTRFQIASITKSFTAIATMMLVDDGRLALEDSIGRYLHDLPAAWRPITVRQLLEHTSGIRGVASYDRPPCDPGKPEAAYQPGDVLREVACLPLDFAPGERWAYGDSGYLLLGMLIASRAGVSYDEFLRARMFAPLAMRDTRMQQRPPERGVARGYRWRAGQFVEVPPMNPVIDEANGGLVSTVLDLARWDAALYTDTLLPQATLQAMWTPARPRSGSAPYGLGFGITPFEGRRRVGHTGGGPGSATAISRLLDERLTVIVLANGEQPQGRMQVLANEIAARYLPSTTFDTLARSSLAQLEGRVALPGLRDSVEVIRDRWGVPHVYARNLDDLFFAQGFVQAQDRLWQMEMYRRTFEGTLSEVMGPSHVAHDRLARLLKFRGPFDDAEWRSYHPEGRRIFDAFAAGVNAFIAQAGDRLPVEFRVTGLVPQRWTAEVALLRTTTAMPTADAIAELRLARDVARVGVDSANRAMNPSPFRQLVVPEGLDASIIGPEVVASLQVLRTGPVRPPLLPRYRALHDALPAANVGVQERSPGSNNWVVSGSRTASGRVIVANDPHRNVANPSIRYLVHLEAPGWRMAGATEAVLPGVMIGYTDRIAWGLTIVGTDQADVYVEELDRATHTQSRFRDAWEPMRTIVDTIRVRDAAPVIVTHRFTRHGPVFFMDTARHRAYAMRTTAHLPGSAGYLSALRYHALEDCRGFLDAQRYFLAPTENMICGDTRGSIAWQASAASPKRPNWHGRLPVPGTGAFEWDGLRTDLPRALDPPRGWIATANHDIHPEGWDPPLFFKRGPSRARYDRIASVLDTARGITLAGMTALQHDAHSVQGARDVALFTGWTARDSTVEHARRALAGWDAQHRRESMAAALYHYAGRAIGAEARAAGTSVARRRVLLEAAIATGMDSLRAAQGRDPAQWRWGRINRTELPHALVRAYDIAPVERHGGAGFVAAVGATFRMVVDMGALDSTLVTNAPGQSGQPGSPHYSDLVASYGRGEYFPLAFTRAAVERVAAHRLVLVPGRR